MGPRSAVPFYNSVWVGKAEPPWGEKKGVWMLVWVVHGRAPLNSPQGGRAELLLPPPYGSNNLFPRAIHARMGAWLQRGRWETGSWNLDLFPSLPSMRRGALDTSRCYETAWNQNTDVRDFN